MYGKTKGNLTYKKLRYIFFKGTNKLKLVLDVIRTLTITTFDQCCLTLADWTSLCCGPGLFKLPCILSTALIPKLINMISFFKFKKKKNLFFYDLWVNLIAAESCITNPVWVQLLGWESGLFDYLLVRLCRPVYLWFKSSCWFLSQL